MDGGLTDRAGGAGKREISDFDPVAAAQGLATVVADCVDPGLLIFPGVAFRALPGQFAS
jgi:hypothetical protein